MAIEESTRSKIEERDVDFTFVHVRIRKDLKKDLDNYAKRNSTSLTAVVNSLIEDLLYTKEEDEEEKVDQDDELLNLVVSSLMNLEQRMDFRLSMLSDQFNSLARTLMESQKLVTRRSEKIKQLRGEATKEEETADVLEIDYEKTIYDRVKRFIADQGKVIDLTTTLKHIELDPTLKNYLNNQVDNIPGWKEALITDAIEEAAYEIGYTMTEEE